MKLVQLIQNYNKKNLLERIPKMCISTSFRLLFDFGRNIANAFKKIFQK